MADADALNYPLITGQGMEIDRIHTLELRQVKTTQFIADQQDDIKEIKGDVKDLRTGQRTLILSLLGSALSFLGLAVSILVAVKL